MTPRGRTSEGGECSVAIEQLIVTMEMGEEEGGGRWVVALSGEIHLENTLELTMLELISRFPFMQ